MEILDDNFNENIEYLSKEELYSYRLRGIFILIFGILLLISFSIFTIRSIASSVPNIPFDPELTEYPKANLLSKEVITDFIAFLMSIIIIRNGIYYIIYSKGKGKKEKLKKVYKFHGYTVAGWAVWIFISTILTSTQSW